MCCPVIMYKENLKGFSWSSVWSALCLWASVDSCRQHMRLLVNDTPAQRVLMCVCVCVCALQVHWLQPAEILVSPWMAVAMGTVGSLATLWPFLVIQVMNCKGRAESPASKWKIDTTGSPALRAVSVRVREIVGAGERVWRRRRVGDVGSRWKSWWKEQAMMGVCLSLLAFCELNNYMWKPSDQTPLIHCHVMWTGRWRTWMSYNAFSY